MNERPFALMLKTYAPDSAFVYRLVSSFHKHNVENLHLFCVVPQADLEVFAPLAAETVTVMSEAPFERYFTSEEVDGIRLGYINQEIVKLAFWELGLVENYFCVDSEAVFLRDFREQDFIAPDGFPFSVLVEDNELQVEPHYYTQYWISREAAHRRIAQEIAFPDPILRTCHGHQTFSSTVLRDFKDNFLTPRGWSYLDALKIAPYEFTWYNLWLQKSEVIPIHQREPYVKVFHHEKQHLEYIIRGITNKDIARGYLAVVVNSNFSRDLGIIKADAPKAELLSHYLSYRELAQLTMTKVRASLKRLGRSGK